MKTFEIRTREKLTNHEQRIKSLERGGGGGGGGNPELEADVKELQQQMEQISDLLYEPIDITSVSVSKYEHGATVTSVTLSWAINKTPTTLTLDGENIDKTLTSKTLTGLNVKSNKTYTLVATDERGATDTGKPAIQFMYYVYYGSVDTTKTIDSSVLSGMKKKLQNSVSGTYDFTGDAVKKPAIAAPYNAPTKVVIGGLDYEWAKIAEFNVTNQYGVTEKYYMWANDNAIPENITAKVS